MQHLQKITTLAKKIRKQHPSKKWTDCVKAASKELKTGKKVGAMSSKTLKTVAKKAGVRLPHGYATIKRKKVSGTEKETHTDKQSHNVKIKVMSGINTYRGVRIEVEKLKGYGHYEITGHFKNGVKKTITTDSTIYDWFNDDSDKKKHQLAKQNALKLLNRI